MGKFFDLKGVHIKPLFIYLIAFLMFLSACGSPGTSTGTSSTTGVGSGGISGVVDSFAVPGDVPSNNPPSQPGSEPSVDDGETPGAGPGGSTGGDIRDDEDAIVEVSISVPPGSGTRRQSVEFTGIPNAFGFLTVDVSVTNATSLQIVSISPNNTSIGTVDFRSPSNSTLVSVTDRPFLTSAVFLLPVVNALPYPTRGADVSLVNGTYRHTLFVNRAGVAGTVNGTVIAKNDSNLFRGVLRVNVFLVGSASQAAESDIITALNVFSTIFADPVVDVNLNVRIFDSNASPILPDPTDGSPFYLQEITRSGVQDLALNVFIGDSIEDFSESLLGISAGIPGAAIPTVRSVVVISLLAHQGVDGVLSPQETVLMGETIAHEAGHYLGLWHVIELGFGASDPLEDTPTCTTFSECITSGAAVNLMFPSPVFDINQQTLTNDQAEVLNLQVIVD
jgi:hypothetical protein